MNTKYKNLKYITPLVSLEVVEKSSENSRYAIRYDTDPKYAPRNHRGVLG
jgi:hypothetical protein